VAISILENTTANKKGCKRMTTYKTVAESNNFIVLDKYTKDWKVAENFQSEGD